VTLCTGVIGYQCIGGPCCLYLQGEGNMAVQNTGILSHHYTVSQPKRPRLEEWRDFDNLRLIPERKCKWEKEMVLTKSRCYMTLLFFRAITLNLLVSSHHTTQHNRPENHKFSLYNHENLKSHFQIHLLLFYLKYCWISEELWNAFIRCPLLQALHGWWVLSWYPVGANILAQHWAWCSTWHVHIVGYLRENIWHMMWNLCITEDTRTQEDTFKYVR